jgi:DNA repair exonuclease SbcCD ATPase subunit
MVKKEKEKDKANTAENIKVIVRCRPLNTKEKENGYKPCVELNLGENTVQVNHVVGDPDRWTFDAVVNNTYSQRDVFTQFIMPMVDSVMDGFNATVFAYGQSGSGKTHTMTGKLDDEDLKGIIPRTFEYVFQTIREQQTSSPTRSFTLSCTFVELYNGKIHDLLAKGQVPLAVKESKDKTFFVQGVNIPQVKFAEDLSRHMEEGTERRRVASTDLNADSSRSHSLFTLIVDMVDSDEDGNTRSVTSKFNLVDLAGSERQSKTGAAGDTLKEGCNINLSLSALGTVIDTLVKGKGHVPFRSSPLTMLLKDSLGGSSKTVMFANIGPSEHNLSETVSTLRFADRAKQIKNKPVVNLDTKDQKIQELTEQVNDLKERLKQFESVGVKKMEDELEQLRERVGELEVDLDNATKGREADAMEAQHGRDSLAAEIAVVKQNLADSEAAAASLRTDAQLIEDQLRDERAQREEIWTNCSAHFGEDIHDVDLLLDKLRGLASSVSKEEHLRAVAEVRSAAAEVEAARAALDVEVGTLRAQSNELNDEIDSLKKKLEKAKERLEKEKDARKLLLTEGASESSALNLSPSKAETAERDTLIQRVDSLSRQLGAAKKRSHEPSQDALRAELQELRNHKQLQIDSLQAELTELRAVVSSHPEDDQSAVAHLKKLLTHKGESLAKANERIARLESRVCGDDTDAPLASSHTHIHTTLREELTTTAGHRDELLRQIVDSDPDVSQQLQRLSEENARLREALLQQDRVATGDDATESRYKEAVEQLHLDMQVLRESNTQREAELVAQIAAAARSGADGDEDDENPLQCVVTVLQRDKTALTNEIARLQRELLSNGAAVTVALEADVSRLQALLAAPRAEDSEQVATLKEELRLRETSIEELKSQVALSSAGTSPQHPAAEVTLNASNSDLSSKLQVAEIDKAELLEQLEAAMAEVAEATEKLDHAKRDMAASVADAATRSKELSEAKVRITALENRVAELEGAAERATNEEGSAANTIESLNTRLKERTEQMNDLRKAIDHFKEAAEGHKQRVEQLRQAAADKQSEYAEREVAHQQALAEQEASFQRLMNKRLEQAGEEHKKALARKDEDILAVKKKMKKVEEKIEKLKEKYDSKVYEYEELVTRMEEQKFEAMRNLRDRDAVVIEEHQERMHDALKAAKEAKRRQADMFANGEVNSAVSGLRGPVGSAAQAARSRGGVTPPSEDISRRSPRPAGYTVGKAVAASSAGGGAGYSGYVPEPPAQTRKPLNEGFDCVPDSYLDSNEGGDIYDF